MPLSSHIKLLEANVESLERTRAESKVINKEGKERERRSAVASPAIGGR